MLKNPAVGEALAAVVPAPTQQQQEREKAANEHWESNTLFETDAELQRQREEEEERLRLQREEEDAVREAPLTALCGLLSEVYGQAPDLPTVASDVLPGFLDAVVEWEHSVESLVGVVGLMAAVASTGVDGARQIWRRMQHPSAGVSVTWDSFISALVGYNRRFQFGGDTPQELEENERRAREAGGGVGYGHSVGAVNPYAAAFSREREMPEADVQGLSAYLGLLSALLEAAPAAEASSWTQWLEGRYGFALLDNLVVLLGLPRCRPS
jgi:nuclear pore complex protein Nup205